jgi:hypothetical protein
MFGDLQILLPGDENGASIAQGARRLEARARGARLVACRSDARLVVRREGARGGLQSRATRSTMTPAPLRQASPRGASPDTSCVTDAPHQSSPAKVFSI